MAQDWDPKQWQLTKTSELTNSNGESHSSDYDGFYEDYGVSHSPDPKRFRTTSPSRYVKGVRSKRAYAKNRQNSSEIPTLEEQSWPDLWSQMLHTDLSADVVLNADADSNAFAEDGSNTCLLAVENDIETWAEANWVSASSSQDMDIEQTGNAFQSVLQTSNRAEVKPVCFGMVRLFLQKQS